MSKINYITRWKIQLASYDRKLKLVALTEIVEMLNNLSEEDSLNSIYLLLVNSEITHFLDRAITYNNKGIMSLVNKIVCHISEIEEFFLRDFFNILRGYLRVVSTFPSVYDDNQKHQSDIFTCMNIFLKRARERDCNFDDLRINFNSILTVIGNLHPIHYIHVPVVEFISQIIEILIKLPSKTEFDQRIRNGKLGEVLSKLHMKPRVLDSTLFSLTTAKVLHTSLIYVNSDLILQKIIAAKFLAFMEFSLDSTKDDEIFEIFCNLIYYFLTSPDLEETLKLQIVNYFFLLNGHRKILLKIFEGKVQNAIELKSLVVMAEVMNIFMTFLSKSIDQGGGWKKKSYEIVLKGTRKNDGKLTNEESMMYVFEKFIDFMWKKKSFDRFEVLSNTAMILAANRGKKSIDPTFFNMLMTLHTSTFVHISVQHNKLLKISASAALQSIKTISAVDLKFLRWWKSIGKPDNKLFNQVSIQFLKQAKLPRIESHEAEIFDKKLILETFLEQSKTSKTLHGNLKEILCSYSDIGKSSNDFRKLLSEWQRLRADKGSSKAMNVMDVIIRNVGSVEEIELKKKTASNFVKIAGKSTASQSEKLLIIELAVNLLTNEQIQLQIE